MLTTIQETRQWIHNLLPHGIKPGTDRMIWMLDKLNHPEKRLRVIHVGGTNGKGSTVTYLREIYQAAGYTIGTFTSPYIEDFNERISVDGRWISDDHLVQAAQVVYPLVNELTNSELGSPTEFEVITMISIVYFTQIERCDLVIYEVGLGGRYDSTNVLTPLVTAITNIGMDHMVQLGDSIEQIAYEKAGIIKSGVGVITASEEPAALSVIKETAKENNSRYYAMGEEFHFDIVKNSNERIVFNYASLFKRYDELSLSLRGEHQIKNAATALMVIDYLSVYYALFIEEDIIRKALINAFWPGRFEKVSALPDIILDGAHNPEGALALSKALYDYYPGRSVHMIYAGLSGKDHAQMLHSLLPCTASVSLTTFNFPRAMTQEEMKVLSNDPKISVNPDFKDTILKIRSQLNVNDVLLITGSLYFISEVRRFLYFKNV